jgi:hypothetical protein
MVYRLGACPCGCIEHNYWLQAVGLADDEHSHAAADLDADGIVASHEHGCTGEPEEFFLNNPRIPGTKLVRAPLPGLLSSHPSVIREATRDYDPPLRGPPHLARGDTHRSALQVFLL